MTDGSFTSIQFAPFDSIEKLLSTNKCHLCGGCGTLFCTYIVDEDDGSRFICKILPPPYNNTSINTPDQTEVSVSFVSNIWPQGRIFSPLLSHDGTSIQCYCRPYAHLLLSSFLKFVILFLHFVSLRNSISLDMGTDCPERINSGLLYCSWKH